MENNKDDIYKQLFKSWYSILKKDLIDSNYFDKLIEFLNASYRESFISPYNKKDVFKAFQKTNYDDLKVVILGQDPYPNGNATGLAFANKDDKLGEEKFSPSLIKIKDCVENSVKNGLDLNFNPTLENWAEQGVLLLNTALTVQYYNPGSHRKYWKRFTENVIKIISDSNPGVIFCLWGANAQSFEPFINKSTSIILKCTHPSYAARKGIYWDCNHFNKINEIITKQNGKKYCIKW